MTLLDRVLVAAGRSYAAISHGGRSPVRARVLIVMLLLLSLVTTVAISLISIPSEKSFDDLRERRYRDLEWLRLEGDLREGGRDDGRHVYVLHDPANPTVAVTVYAPGPLPTGATQVTGQQRNDARLEGTFDTFYADAVTEPARHDPWPLIALPALFALFLIVGGRAGYPVVRREDRPTRAEAGTRPLATDEKVAARWSGWLQGEIQPLDKPRDSTLAVGRDAEVSTLTVVDALGARSLVVRRASPRPVGRVCRVRGCTPHLEIHAPGGDVLFEFGSVEDRNRIAEALGNPTSRS